MSGPLQGVGYQNIPLSSPYQPGGQNSTQVRENREQAPRENEIQPQEAAPAQSQEVDTQAQSRFDETETAGSSRVALTDEQPEQRRGSVVDLSV